MTAMPIVNKRARTRMELPPSMCCKEGECSCVSCVALEESATAEPVCAGSSVRRVPQTRGCYVLGYAVNGRMPLRNGDANRGRRDRQARCAGSDVSLEACHRAP